MSVWKGGGAGIATKQLVLPFYQIISLWDAALRWKENLSSFNCLRFSFGGTDWTGKAPTSNFSTDRVSIAHTLEQSQNHNPRLVSAISIILYIPLPIGISQSFLLQYIMIRWALSLWVLVGRPANKQWGSLSNTGEHDARIKIKVTPQSKTACMDKICSGDFVWF